MSGYGESGPYVDRPGQDLLLQALSGAMLSAGRASDPPQPAGQFLADAITAYTAFEGALAALLHRARTGEGPLVQEIGRASCRERVCPYVYISGVAATIKKKNL